MTESNSEPKSEKCSTVDKVSTDDLKDAVDVKTDESAPTHEKKKADAVIETVAKEAKKAEAFEPKKPEVGVRK